MIITYNFDLQHLYINSQAQNVSGILFTVMKSNFERQTQALIHNIVQNLHERGSTFQKLSHETGTFSKTSTAHTRQFAIVRI